MLVIGGESLASDGRGDEVSLTLNGELIAKLQVAAGRRFFERLPIDSCQPGPGEYFCRLVASYERSNGAPAPIRLTQLAVEPSASVFFVPQAGWNEIEYSRELQRRWRWTTASAVTFVNNAGRDLMLTLAGESPLRYFDSAPRVTIRAGSSILATTSPASDFTVDVKIPAEALQAADGMLTIETDKSFVPHDRNGSPDRRTLGLRVLEFLIR
jgi:hypothetical protein